MSDGNFALRTRVSTRRVKAVADNSGDPENTGGGVRVDHALRDIVRGLDEASSNEDIAKSLSLLGSLFQMQNVYLVPRKSGQGRREAFLSASPGMRRAANALAKPALANALGNAKEPISLSEVVRGLGPDWSRPRELQGLEAVATTVDVSRDFALHVVFFGKHGVVSGLSKSLLFLGTYLAAHRRAGASGRPDALRALSDRERQVLNLAKSGLTDAKIGKMLGIATRTVRFHLSNAMRKSGAVTRSQLIAKSSQRTLK